MINKNSKIYIAGHNGLVGSAIVRCLQAKGYQNILLRRHRELDLLKQVETEEFLRKEKPEYIFLAAAKVGGIHANNQYRADFIYQNLMIELNIINAAKSAGVNGLLFLGSSCIYPKECLQPIKEEYLLTGALEATNEAYAVAKIAGIKLCESYNFQYGTHYVAAMPTNLYGPRDNFDLETSHVMPALMRKIHEAKTNTTSTVFIWGSGKPEREFLHVDDLADACVYIMEQGIKDGLYNIGTGIDISINQLAQLLAEIIGYKGSFEFDASKPDGTLKKVLDVSKLAQQGWQAKIKLADGIRQTYHWYLENHL